MGTRICIHGPYRTRKKPKRRFLAQGAYYLLAGMGGAAYLIYLMVAG